MQLTVISLWFLMNLLGFDLLPWERYVNLGSAGQPLGSAINQTSLAHQHFLIGYLCLHSFHYESAQEAFAMALEEDNTFVEAHIGRLLGFVSITQTLWEYMDREGTLQAWNETWAIFNNSNVTLTPYQLAYLNTVYQWFAYENISDGEDVFLQSMLNLTQTFPIDTDAQTQLGLVYLNIAIRETFELQMLEPPAMLEARKVLQKVLAQEPSHPGCLHYLIHACDIPRVGSAVQAIPYAHSYREIVRTASHAQHMATHTWIRIGAWPLAQEDNERSVNVSVILCMLKLNQMNSTDVLSFTFSELLIRLIVTEAQGLIVCDFEHVGHLYSVQGHMVIEGFFWLMYHGKRNQE
ncbi:unnamed protein product [Adineta ricciae]|uniref:Uncharacterized protein n=1 Tax=Adineta ricciae TaxID=249248 RepID=A0A814QXK5_ADIRI|nr:unnamed protein product [Adineta ricciae]